MRWRREGGREGRKREGREEGARTILQWNDE
jgi:hypothetical protein